MNSWERIKRMYEHKEADRVPIIDDPWRGTLARWYQEGMPGNVSWEEYFDVDKIAAINVDISPRYERKIIEETDTYYIATDSWGVTTRNFKAADSTPEFLDYKVVDPESWADAKSRMTLDDDRIPWAHLKENFPKWREEGRWIRSIFWFGFDVAHSWMSGLETILIAMMEEPDFVKDIIGTYLKNTLALYERMWDAGYHFDEMMWYDDMGYKGTSFFSPETYREILQPFHKKAVDWVHDRGIVAQLHSCGNVMGLLPDIIATGVDALNPLEVKAGMDAIKIKREYGDKLLLRGGINAQQWDNTEAIIAEIDHKIPILKENGGFIFSSDHSIPNSVSLENMKAIINEIKRVGRY